MQPGRNWIGDGRPGRVRYGTATYMLIRPRPMVRLQARFPLDFWVLTDPGPLFWTCRNFLTRSSPSTVKTFILKFWPHIGRFFLSRSRLRTGRIRIQKTCRSDFSSSASPESGKLSGKQRFCAAESALKPVDLSRIGQRPINCSCIVLKSTNWKFEKTVEFSYPCICTQFSVE